MRAFMAMRHAFISDLKFLTSLVSLCGVTSLALAGLMPPLMFAVVLLIHIAAYIWLFDREILPSYFFGIFTAAVFVGEGIRIFFYGGETVLPALRDMILILALGRLVLKKTSREIYQILGISLAECILATVFTTSPVFLVGLMFDAFLIPVVLNLLDSYEFEKKEPAKLPAFNHWAFIFISIVGVSFIMFFVIPRPSSTLLNLSLVKKHRTGFSEEVNLAREDTLDQDRGIVMRLVHTSGQVEKRIYLSGARLEILDKSGFKKAQTPQTEAKDFGSFTDSFTIYPTDIDSKNVFFPFTFVSINPHIINKQGLNLYWNKDAPPVYEVNVTRRPNIEGRQILDVPASLKKIAALGKDIAPDGTAPQKAAGIIKYLSKTCTYSLEGLPADKDKSPVEIFLEKKRGACEHFASAMAVMLRGAGVPSRVATGFLVTEFNTSGNYYMIRASDAHAWVEYWDGSAWIMADPTPQGGVQISRAHSNWLDAMRFRWIRWVIEYSLKDQINFAKYVRFNAPKIPKAAATPKWLSLIIPIFIMLASIFIFVRHHKMTLYEKALSALRRKGLKLEESPEYELHLLQIKQQWPQMAAAFEVYQKNYLSWRFGGRNVDIRMLTEEFIKRIGIQKK